MKAKFSKRSIIYWWIFLSWASFVCFLSSLSASKLAFVPHPFVGFDKVVHVVLFTAGGVSLAAALRETLSLGWRGVFLTSVLCLFLFGISDEFHQVFTEGRSGLDVGDWVADASGAMLGALLLVLVPRGTRGGSSRPANNPPRG